MKNRIFGSLLMGFLTLSAVAQVSSTLSPYSQFGIGVLSDQSLGFNRGMGGLAMGLRNGKMINIQNPASYSAVDSLTMLFDVGVTGQKTSFKEGGKKVNAKTGNFDYAVASFRLLPKVGFSFGVVPYSNIGYDYYKSETIGSSSNVIVESHTGKGGLTQAFVGAGWQCAPGMSVGANISYFWGNYDKSVSMVSNDSYVNILTKSYTATVSSYKIDLGIQVQKPLNADDLLTIGAVCGLGHNLGTTADMITTNTNSQTGVTASVTDSVPNALSLPTTLAIGATLLHKKSLLVGLDYMFQNWGSQSYPMLNSQTKRYESMSGQLMNRHRVTAGLDWVPNPMSRRLVNHIHYRLGLSYATPYYKIQGQDGPKEFGVSGGFGIPIINSWNNRTVLNISAQWIQTSAPGLIKENTFRINLGLTFNERWFAKWKVD